MGWGLIRVICLDDVARALVFRRIETRPKQSQVTNNMRLLHRASRFS